MLVDVKKSRKRGGERVEGIVGAWLDPLPHLAGPPTISSPRASSRERGRCWGTSFGSGSY